MNINIEKQHGLSYLPYLDGWRGIAIIGVLIEHFNSYEAIHGLGGFGVNVFFVLSGFLMSRILFIKKVPLNIFYRRRVARILPVFLLYISVVFIGWWLLFNEFHPKEFLSTAFFLRTYFPEAPAILRAYVPIGHIWSLNVEEHCYILLSLISLLATRFNEFFARIALTFCSVLCVVFFIFYKNHPPASQSLFFSRSEVAAFALLLSCTIYLWLAKYPIKIPQFVPALSFLIALGIALVSTSVFLTYMGVSVLLAISVNTLNVAPVWLVAILSSSILRWLGTCSYSIYLWQQPFYFSKKYAGDWSYYWIFAIVMSLLVASCSFYFFEKPMRKWLSGKA